MENEELKLIHYLSKNGSNYEVANPIRYKDFFELSDTGLAPGNNVVSIKVSKGEDVSTHNLNINISANSRNKLVFSKAVYDEKYNNLVSTINEIVEKRTVTEEDRENLAIAFNEYGNSLSEFQCAFIDALDEISEAKVSGFSQQLDKKLAQLAITAESITSKVESVESITNGMSTEINAAKGEAANAKKAAEAAAKKAQDALDDSNKANELFQELASDDKITPSEKQSTKLEWDKIAKEKQEIIKQALEFEVSYFDYENKYNELEDYIRPILQDLGTTSDIVGEDFRNKFSNYYTERQKLLNEITKKAKEIADDAKKKVETLETEVITLGNRISSAEEIIEPGRIVHTVRDSVEYKADLNDKANKDDVYTKEEIEEKRYATKSDVEQTSRDFKFILEESGGYNLISNSDGSNETKSWKAQNSSTLTNDYDYEKLAPTGSEYGICIGTNGTRECFASSDRFPLKPGKSYSFSGWYLVEDNSNGIDFYILGSNTINPSPANETYAYDWEIQVLSNNESTNGKYVKFHGVFETPEGCKSAYVRVDNNGSKDGRNCKVRFTRLLLTQGTIDYQWSNY